MASLRGDRASARINANRHLDSDMSPSVSLNYDEDSSDDDGAPTGEDEERLQAQRKMQMLDLGTSRREFVTTCDKPLARELRQSTQQLLRTRQVEEEGTDAARWFQENRTAVTAWNNIGTQIARDNADREQLDEMMGGQSHRARLNKDIKEQGGQNYGESSNVVINDVPRRGRGGGFAGRGVPGRSGRGAPMHSVSVVRTNGGVLATANSSVPTGPKANRPLDPAIDPNRERSYQSKRGGKAYSMSYNGGQPARNGAGLGRGNISNDARATMNGSTVRIGPAPSSKAKSEQSQPSRTPRAEPAAVVLYEQAFLKTMKSVQTRSTFHDHVQEKPKPAPASKAAALVEQAATATEKAAVAQKKTISGLTKSLETPADAYRKTEARASTNSPNGNGHIRLAPTREFAFPPPITRSGRGFLQDSNVSVHTEGVETATTFDSEDFATESPGYPLFKANLNRETIIIDAKSTGQNGATKSQPSSGVEGPGIHVLSPAQSMESKPKDDLILLDEDAEQSQSVAKAFTNDGFDSSNADSLESPSIPDIMDEELDVDVRQSVLTPMTSVVPRCIGYRGARYIRADLVFGDGSKDNAKATRPGRHREESTRGVSDRIPVTGSVNIGSQSLPGSVLDSILGEHNLPMRSSGRTAESSTPLLETSQWATGIGAPAARRTNNHNPLLSTQRRVTSAPTRQPRLNHRSFPSAPRDDTEMTDTSAISSAQEKIAPVTNLAASKYATPGAQVVTSHGPSMDSLRYSEFTKSSVSSRERKDKNPPSTAPQTRQGDFVPTSQTSRSQTERVRQEVTNPTGTTAKSSPKTSDLAASEWGDISSEPMTSSKPKKSFGYYPRQAPLPSVSSQDVGVKENPVVESQQEEHRRRNPFGTSSVTSKPAPIEIDDNFFSSYPNQHGYVSTMAERSGNIPAANQQFASEERVTRGKRANASAEQSVFNFSGSAHQKSATSIESIGPKRASEDQRNGSSIRQKKPPPTNDLFASKHAPKSTNGARESQSSRGTVAPSKPKLALNNDLMASKYAQSSDNGATKSQSRHRIVAPSKPTPTMSNDLMASQYAPSLRNDAIESQFSRTVVALSKPKPTPRNDLMASRYAAPQPTTSSYRKLRRIRSDSSSDESEL